MEIVNGALYAIGLSLPAGKALLNLGKASPELIGFHYSILSRINHRKSYCLSSFSNAVFDPSEVFAIRCCLKVKQCVESLANLRTTDAQPISHNRRIELSQSLNEEHVGASEVVRIPGCAIYVSSEVAIFDTYGPNQEYCIDPESEMAIVWKRKVLSHILPNNRKLLAILTENRPHLTAAEREILERFRQHVDDLEQRHVGDSTASVGTRFPDGMSRLLENV